MLDNPEKEWRRLTEHYASMYDEQLQELAADFNNLTEMAQQALRAELQKRNLADHPEPERSTDRRQEQDASHGDETENDSDLPPEYTWKTFLCDCETADQALHLREALRRAGIESWVEAFQYDLSIGRGPRILVAADQFEEARAIASQPIPEDVIRHFNTPVEEFEVPLCPQCGGEESVLLGVEPTNSWSCETCGHEWSEAEDKLDSARS